MHACPASSGHGFARAAAPACVAAVLLAAAGCGLPGGPDRRVRHVERRAARSDAGITTNALADAVQVREPATSNTPVQLDRESSLRLAARHAPDLQSRREQLYLEALSLAGTGRDFGLKLSGSLEYALGLRGDAEDQETTRLGLRASRLLPTGGRVDLSGGTTYAVTPSTTNGADSTTHASSVGLLIEQPLLAGAGYGASHEALIQGERDLRYALRAFTLDRQDFSIAIAAEYYQVLNQKTVLANTRLYAEQAEFLLKRSEALFKVRRATYLDVLRARQEALTARNRLNAGETQFETLLKRFLLKLGVPAAAPAVVIGIVPKLETVSLDETRCVELALRRRLDLATVHDRRADAARRVRLARNGLLPALSVYGRADWTGDDEDRFADQNLEDEASAGVKLTLPLDRRDERDALKRAQIARAAADREVEQRVDEVRIEIAESFRRLGTLATAADIERQNVDIATQRARNAALRFRNGELSNRDVVEAENELLDARNAYTQALIDCELQRLRLLRNVGLLDVTPAGDLVELPAPGP